MYLPFGWIVIAGSFCKKTVDITFENCHNLALGCFNNSQKRFFFQIAKGSEMNKIALSL